MFYFKELVFWGVIKKKEMSKTVELSDKQFKDLTTLVHLGLIMSSREYETDDLFDSAQYFYSYAKEFNCSDKIKYSKIDSLYFSTKKLDEIAFPIVENYQEESFWSELAFRLATQDFENENSMAAIRKMTELERFATVMGIAEAYEDEFYESGLAHFGRIEER